MAKTELPRGSWAGRRDGGIEDIVLRLDDLLRAVEELPGGAAADKDVEAEMLDAARRTLDAERARGRLFSPDMFPNPGWAMLLHLLISGGEGRQVDTRAACAAAGVPENVALRHIAVLVAGKLVRREPGRDDPATYLALTPLGKATLCEYFGGAPKARDAAAA